MLMATEKGPNIMVMCVQLTEAFTEKVNDSSDGVLCCGGGRQRTYTASGDSSVKQCNK